MVLLLYHIILINYDKEGRITMAIIHHQFGPIFDEHSKILILGSFPSVKSREKAFYYQHPQNRFWRILSMLYDEEFVNSSQEHLIQLLHKYHIALYDVVESCEIKGSSDQSLKPDTFSNIDEIIKHSEITHLFFNGRKAYDLYCKQKLPISQPAIYLPSTSPANAKMSLPDLLTKWQDILKR